MIGNDVVDYSVDEKKYNNQRYVDRCLSELESKFLNQSEHKNQFFWCLWAAKEAAYKAVQREQNSCIFSPPTFEVHEKYLLQLLDHDFKRPFKGELRFEQMTLYFELTLLNPSVVHCVASHYEKALSHCQTIFECNNHATDYTTQSLLVRALANRLLLKNNIQAKIERPEIKLNHYSKPGPPILVDEASGNVLSDLISLSHDKKWLAAVLLVKGKTYLW